MAGKRPVKAEPKKHGRPSSYTEALAEEICERLSRGEPLAVICRDEHMPDRTTVYDWQKADDGFSQRFARAREQGFDWLAAECLHIADDKAGDIKTVGEDEREVCDTEFVQRAKLRIETRLKLLAKWDPKRYGDSVQVKHADADGEKLPPDDTQVAARMAALMALAAHRKGSDEG